MDGDADQQPHKPSGAGGREVGGSDIPEPRKKLPLPSPEKLQAGADEHTTQHGGARGEGEGRGRAINEKKKLISSTFQEKPAACKILHSK